MIRFVEFSLAFVIALALMVLTFGGCAPEPESREEACDIIAERACELVIDECGKLDESTREDCEAFPRQHCLNQEHDPSSTWDACEEELECLSCESIGRDGSWWRTLCDGAP